MERHSNFLLFPGGRGFLSPTSLLPSVTLNAKKPPFGGQRARALTLFVLVSIYIFAPYIWLFAAVFSESASFVTKIPDKFTLQNFVEAFTGESRQWIVNSLVLALSATVGCVCVASLGGYGLSRASFRGKGTLLNGIILIRVLPLALLVVPIFSILLVVNLLDSYAGLIVVMATLELPVGLWIMKGAVDAIPIEVEEAAQIDGAIPIQIIYMVILPLIKPGLAALSVLTFVSSWGEFLLPFVVLLSESKMPISVGIYSAFGLWGEMDYTLLATLSLMYITPPIVYYVFLGPYFSRGFGSIGVAK